MEKRRLLPIGQFAQASGLSLKALRLYDALDIRASELAEASRQGFAELYTIVGPLTFSDSAFIRYHSRLNDEEASEIEFCLPFWGEAAHPALAELPENVRVIDVSAAQFAHTRLVGADAAFPALFDGYDAVSDWIVRHGFTLTGPAYEVYLRWCGMSGHPDNVIEVGWIVEPS
jgi:hypothetical protein